MVRAVTFTCFRQTLRLALLQHLCGRAACHGGAGDGHPWWRFQRYIAGGLEETTERQLGR